MKKTLKIIFTAAIMMWTAVTAPSAGISAESEKMEKIRVMPLGDSITDGFSTVGGYRNALCDILTATGYADKIDFVGPNWGGSGYDPQHAGFSGYAIDDIPAEESISGPRKGLSGLVDQLLTEYPADIVMLQIGTNDILSNYDLDNIGARLEKLVDKILTYIPENGILFISPITCMDASDNLYINEDYFTVERMDECVEAYNEAIMEIADRKNAEGKNIIYAKIGSTVHKEKLYDGVHPNETGYGKMGFQWFGYLKSYILYIEGKEAEVYSLLDFIHLRNHLLGKSSITEDDIPSCDVNNDNIIDIYDYALMKQEMKPFFIEYSFYKKYYLTSDKS